MTTPQNLGTPKCPAEQRAWLLIYQKRLGMGKPLTEAFNNQFPYRDHSHVQIHAAHARNCDAGIQSQLLELAKQFPWYEDPPRKGEKHYVRMKHFERRQEARDRIRTRGLQRGEDPMGQDAGADGEGLEGLETAHGGA